MSDQSIFAGAPRPADAGSLAAKQFENRGDTVWVGIGRPVPFPRRAGWCCRVRVERDTRLEQSQVVAASKREVLRLALELVTGRLGVTESQFLDGAAVDADASAELFALAR
ncbi:MAG TPA: hypothetical protein VK083_02765 [Nocardia sp.]|uniref:hypothetical protein n=1 Tax=Nocardia TaxID=1817 RepID=UPI002455F827|nr:MULTISPECIES: hypothetical protein [Nocardia]HLS75699.1 hypothetical protein [Nocardia sp.]